MRGLFELVRAASSRGRPSLLFIAIRRLSGRRSTSFSVDRLEPLHQIRVVSDPERPECANNVDGGNNEYWLSVVDNLFICLAVHVRCRDHYAELAMAKS